MKRKGDSSKVATKSDLTILKVELNASIDRLLQYIRQEITFSMEAVEEKFDRKLTRHTSLILTTIDRLLKELETRREDREIASSQSAKMKDQIIDHEDRIKILESA